MSSSPSEEAFVCDCKPEDRRVCKGRPYRLKDLQYCLLHLPDKDEEQGAAFKDALQGKLANSDFDFSGFWFPDDFYVFKGRPFDRPVIFRNATFNVPATFSDAEFSKEADFGDATFNARVTFRSARFAKVDFGSTIFRQDVSFRSTRFEAKADFYQAEFGNHADFTEAIFEENAEPNFWDAKFLAGTNFEKAEFKGRTNFEAVTFKGETNFNYATFDGTANFREATFRDRVVFDFTSFGRKDAPVTARDASFAKVDFGSTVFRSEVSFRATVFTEKAEFDQAEFRNSADFTEAIFQERAKPNFWAAKFLARAKFDKAMFKGRTNFDEATFKGATTFNYAAFDGPVNFRDTIFQHRVFFEDTAFTGDAKFFRTTFKDYVRFKGKVFVPESRPDFRDIKSADSISFHSFTARPHWFVGLNASKFELVNVHWDWREITIDQEIGAIERNYKDVSPYLLLEIACGNLATHAEENHRYEEASRFRYMAMEARRQSPPWREAGGVLVRWKSFWSEFSWKSFWRRLGRLHWLYWFVSGYGEKVFRASMVLFAIWLGFASIYALAVRDETGWLAGLPRSLVYSAAVMTLQRPEPLSSATLVKGLVILETILGPIQAALLALAIRRKFMR